MTPPEMIAEKDFAGRQSMGKRAEQEDTYGFSVIPAQHGAARGLLLLVADGMGGHAAGQLASDLAARTFISVFHRSGDTMRERLSRGLDAANDAIAAEIDARPDELEGMGTTLLAVAVTPLGLEWLSVGDSPLYLWRRGTLRRVNADHSFRPVLQEMVAKGEVTPEQAALNSLRNRLRSALTGGEIALVDHSPTPLPLLEGDIVLAGSDGLQTLSDEAIAEVLKAHASAEASALAMRVVKTVLEQERPKQDNTTAAIVKPTAEWLLAPFAFAPPRRPAGDEDVGRTTTQIVVPATARPGTNGESQPATPL